MSNFLEFILENRNNADTEGNAGYEPEPGQPSTPPPSYSVLERQISYVSHISQSSSQIEEPPDYTDALDLPQDGVSRAGARSVSQYGGGARRRSSSSGGSRISRLRSRLFSRSISANATSSMQRNDSNTSADQPPDFTVRESDSSDHVFIDLSTIGPQGHSTPHPSSAESSLNTGQTSLGSRNANASQLTTISSIDENDVGSNQSIFEHINRLNEESPDLSDLTERVDGVGIPAEAASSIDVSDVVPHCVSQVALLTNDGAPNNGATSAM